MIQKQSQHIIQYFYLLLIFFSTTTSYYASTVEYLQNSKNESNVNGSSHNNNQVKKLNKKPPITSFGQKNIINSNQQPKKKIEAFVNALVPPRKPPLARKKDPNQNDSTTNLENKIQKIKNSINSTKDLNNINNGSCMMEIPNIHESDNKKWINFEQQLHSQRNNYNTLNVTTKKISININKLNDEQGLLLSEVDNNKKKLKEIQQSVKDLKRNLKLYMSNDVKDKGNSTKNNDLSVQVNKKSTEHNKKSNEYNNIKIRIDELEESMIKLHDNMNRSNKIHNQNQRLETDNQHKIVNKQNKQGGQKSNKNLNQKVKLLSKNFNNKTKELENKLLKFQKSTEEKLKKVEEELFINNNRIQSNKNLENRCKKLEKQNKELLVECNIIKNKVEKLENEVRINDDSLKIIFDDDLNKIITGLVLVFKKETQNTGLQLVNYYNLLKKHISTLKDEFLTENDIQYNTIRLALCTYLEVITCGRSHQKVKTKSGKKYIELFGVSAIKELSQKIQNLESKVGQMESQHLLNNQNNQLIPSLDQLPIINRSNVSNANPSPSQGVLNKKKKLQTPSANNSVNEPPKNRFGGLKSGFLNLGKKNTKKKKKFEN